METQERVQFPFRPRRGVPLSTAFFLLAVCGVFAKITAVLWQFGDNEDYYARELQERIGTSVIGVIVFGVVGGIVGAFQSRPLSGMIIVGSASAVCGGILAPAVLLSNSNADDLFSTTITGSLLLVAVAMLLRWLSSRSEG